MKKLSTILVFIALAMNTFTGCSGSDAENNDIANTKSYIIETLDNKDIPSTATMLALSEDTKVKITRDVESDMMNVYVFKGRVEVTH